VVQLTMRGTGHVVRGFARENGEPGRNATCTINPGRDDAKSMPSRFSALALKRSDVVQAEKGGGGGLGDPRRRPFEKVVDDVLDHHVSRDAAIASYGVDPARLDAALAAWGA
jgi:N-methylhydantoinase B